MRKTTDVPKSLIRSIFEVGNGALNQPIHIILECCNMLKCSPEFGEFKNFEETFRNFDGTRRNFYQVSRADFHDLSQIEYSNSKPLNQYNRKRKNILRQFAPS